MSIQCKGHQRSTLVMIKKAQLTSYTGQAQTNVFYPNTTANGRYINECASKTLLGIPYLLIGLYRCEIENNQYKRIMLMNDQAIQIPRAFSFSSSSYHTEVDRLIFPEVVKAKYFVAFYKLSSELLKQRLPGSKMIKKKLSCIANRARVMLN